MKDSRGRARHGIDRSIGHNRAANPAGILLVSFVSGKNTTMGRLFVERWIIMTLTGKTPGAPWMHARASCLVSDSTRFPVTFDNHRHDCPYVTVVSTTLCDRTKAVWQLSGSILGHSWDAISSTSRSIAFAKISDFLFDDAPMENGLSREN